MNVAMTNGFFPQRSASRRRRERAGQHRGRLHRDQQSERRRIDADDVDGVEHEEDVDQTLAGADEHVREQQPPQGTGQRPPDLRDAGRVMRHDRVQPHAAHDQQRGAGQGDRDHESDAHPRHDAMGRDEPAADHRRHQDRNPAENGLHREADRAALARQTVAHDGEQRRARHAGPRHHEDDPEDDRRPRRRRRHHRGSLPRPGSRTGAAPAAGRGGRRPSRRGTGRGRPADPRCCRTRRLPRPARRAPRGTWGGTGARGSRPAP